MDKNKLLQERDGLLESLIEKTQFIYSEDFYKLPDNEKQMFIKEKIATEAHISSLSNLLWSESSQCSGLFDMFGLAIIGSMFGGMLPQTKQEVYQFPTKYESTKSEDLN